MPLPPRAPQPSHRHSAPSAPWPFLDIDDEVDTKRIEDTTHHDPHSARPCSHALVTGASTSSPDHSLPQFCWCKYPQSLFPNWTQQQQRKSRIADVIAKDGATCTIEYLDVLDLGDDDVRFVDAGKRDVGPRTWHEHWQGIVTPRPSDVRVRCLFVEDISGPVLQMLGTRHNIEPFLFTSSMGWAPSRFQSHVRPKESDHITITLPFIRTLRYSDKTVPPTPDGSFVAPKKPDFTWFSSPEDFMIDTQSPLRLRSNNHMLIHDLLTLHLIRNATPGGQNTILSLHPPSSIHHTTTPSALKARLALTSRSVYWKTIFHHNRRDPTFVFLSLLWYPLYAWDEVMEALYSHVCELERKVLLHDDTTDRTDIQLETTNELHLIRAHILHYTSLLLTFRKAITFLCDTPHPALVPSSPYFTPEERQTAQRDMDIECKRLAEEVERLESSIEMLDKRLKNVMDLGFSVVNIEESRYTRGLTEATVRDSAAMKQIAYLSMIFLPPSFVATIFGMNITTLQDEVRGTINQYVAISIPLTVVTIWIIVAYQIQITGPTSPSASSSSQRPSTGIRTLPSRLRLALTRYRYYGPGYEEPGVGVVPVSIWTRLWWPLILIITVVEKKMKRMKEREDVKRGLGLKIQTPDSSD